MRFIISIFGSKHIGMLITNLYSIQESNPNAKISVLWEDISEKYINPVIKTFEKLSFIKTNVGFTNDPIKRIASKTIVWQMGADKYPNENLAFIDVDMIVLQDISHYFKQSFDIMFTYKNEQYPINTGVILCGKTYKTQLFFEQWKNETLKILQNESDMKKASDSNYPYGAPDQMSFYQMIDYKRDKTEFVSKINNTELIVKGELCERLNQTNSTSIKDDTHIIHYKGGWQPILIQAYNFTKNRTRKASWDMYIKYLQLYTDAIKLINKKTQQNFNPNYFKIIIPNYINLETLKINKLKYLIFQTVGWFKRYIEITTNFIKRKINN